MYNFEFQKGEIQKNNAFKIVSKLYHLIDHTGSNISENFYDTCLDHCIIITHKNLTLLLLNLTLLLLLIYILHSNFSSYPKDAL